MNILSEIKQKEMNRYQWIMVDKKNPKNIIATGKKDLEPKQIAKRKSSELLNTQNKQLSNHKHKRMVKKPPTPPPYLFPFPFAHSPEKGISNAQT